MVGMIGPQLTRIQVAEALVRHARWHVEHVDSSLPAGFWVLRELRESGQLEVVAVERRERPVEGGEAIYWNFEIRHAIDDLRSALEYCAADAFARSSGEGTPGYDNVAFPVCQSQTDFDGWIKGRLPRLRQVYPKVVDVMQTAQPYADPSKNWWLEELHHLWNEGKHRNPHYFLWVVVALPPSDGSGVLDPRKIAHGLKFASTKRLLSEFFRAASDGTDLLVRACGSALYPSGN